MTTSTNLKKICILLAAAFLATGCAVNGDGIGAIVLIVLGAAWLLGDRMHWHGLASLMFACFIGTAILGSWLAYPVGWVWFALLGLIAILNAWDLDHFLQRWRQTVNIDLTPDIAPQTESVQVEPPPLAAWQALEHSHLMRLLVVDIAGLLLAALALMIRIQVGFSAAFLLGILAVWGLSRTIRILGRESD